ncbi:hypothetical protein D3C73_1063360 [compost metagenome]
MRERDASARRRRSTLALASSCGRAASNWSSSAAPTLPGPITPTANVCGDSQNPACAARSARVASALATATEMLRSDDPCAIARMFTCARPSDSNSRAATPGWPAMPSPTAASTLTPSLTCTRCTWPAASSCENACTTASRPRAASPARTTQQIECSEEPCEIITTETCAWRSAANTRSAVPGTPIRPVPSRFSRARSALSVSPFTGPRGERSALMRVPGWLGWNVLRMKIGRPSRIAGDMVCGCTTLAPK